MEETLQWLKECPFKVIKTKKQSYIVNFITKEILDTWLKRQPKQR